MELGARSSLGLVAQVLREARIAKLDQLKGNGPLSGDDAPNIGFRRWSILYGRRVDWQSRAFDEFKKDSSLSRRFFRLGVVSVAQNWLLLIGGPGGVLMRAGSFSGRLQSILPNGVVQLRLDSRQRCREILDFRL
jgi:hypothetical protein